MFCSHPCRQTFATEGAQTPFFETGPAALAYLRAKGEDPAHGGEVGLRRGRTNAKHAMDRDAWEAEHGDWTEERKSFEATILQKLAQKSLVEIMSATGLSRRYAALIRKGERVPHPVHFESLMNLVNPIR